MRIPEDVLNQFEADMLQTVTKYIKNCYPEHTPTVIKQAAGLTYHYWDDIREYVPTVVEMIKKEHTCDYCGKYLEDEPCSCNHTRTHSGSQKIDPHHQP